MKKFTLLLATLLATCNLSFGQAITYFEAPPFDNGTSVNRAPNGTAAHTYMRACILVLQSELTNIPPNSLISSFGFTMNSGTNLNAVTGNFTLYIENSTDVTFSKSTNFQTAVSTMTNVYGSVMTVPTSATSSSISITLSTPFTYTGGALYVAYDWASSGPFDLTAAVYRCNYLGLVSGCYTGISTTSAPTTIATASNWRPNFLFGIANTFTNDIQVQGVEAPGRVATVLNTPHVIKAVVKNGSNIAHNNITVNLNVTGANPFTDSQTISNMISGATTTVSFNAFNPMNNGTNTITVSVSSDEDNTNNVKTYAQVVSCNEWAQNPGAGTYTDNAIGFGAGSGILATPFITPGSSTITGIRGAISNDPAAPTNKVYGVLLDAAGVVVATTNTITLTTAMLGTFQQFNFASPQTISPATTYYLGLAQMAPAVNPYYPAGTQDSGHLPPNLYTSTPLNGGVFTPITQNFGYFGLEAILGHTANVMVASTASAICNGTCAVLNAQGTTSYAWSEGSTGPSVTICPSVTTTYTVLGTNAQQCNSSATVMLIVNPLPNLTATSSKTAICLSESVTLNSSGASTYNWDLGPATASFTDAPVETTVYTVTGTSAAGCSITKTVEVIVNSFTPTITSPATICVGGSTTLTVSGNAPFAWSPPYIYPTNVVSPTVTTSYTATSVGPNGCKGRNETTVTVNPNPTVTATAQRSVMCQGEKNTLTATGASTYSWNQIPNGTTGTVVVTPNIDLMIYYSVTGYNSAGCSHTAQVAVKVNKCTGLLEGELQNTAVSIFPNPTNGMVNVHLETPGQNTSLKIYNAVGALVKQQVLSSETTSLDMRQEAGGIYFIYVYRDNKVIHTGKVVKH